MKRFEVKALITKMTYDESWLESWNADHKMSAVQ